MPAPRDRDRLGIPLPPQGAVRVTDDGPVEGANRGRPIFRVRGTYALRLGRMVTIPILLAGGLAAGPLARAVTVSQVLAAAAAAAAVALLVGRAIRDDRCSEPRCGARLPAEADVCPRCGGTIAGTIDHPHDRLEALERLERRPPPDGGADRAPRG